MKAKAPPVTSRPIYSIPLFAVAALCGAALAGCSNEQAANGEPPARVFYLNSYHQGYAPSDQVMEAIAETLNDAGVELEIHFLDSKRQPEETALKRNAEKALEAIAAYQPDLLIASDDDAIKYVVEPHFKEGPLPVVFCGVNWSAQQYGMPTDTVTGMLEVVPVEEALRTLTQLYPESKKLAVLSEDSTSERSNRALLDPVYRKLGLEPSYLLVSDFETWKAAFEQANHTADLIYLPTNGAISGWEEDAAVAHVEKFIRKPVFTCDDFMMPYCVVGFTKVAAEQGAWAAKTALEILAGRSPADIPVVSNLQTERYYNKTLADRIAFELEQPTANSAAYTTPASPSATRLNAPSQ